FSDAAHGALGRRVAGREVAVSADAVTAVVGGQPAGDARAPVASLSAIAGVAGPGHEPGDDLGHALRTPAAPLRLARKPEAGQRGTDYMEGVLCLAAVGHGIGERPDDLVKLDEGAGPAVRDDQRQCVLLFRPHMDKVEVDPVNFGLELVELVQFPLLVA